MSFAEVREDGTSRVTVDLDAADTAYLEREAHRYDITIPTALEYLITGSRLNAAAGRRELLQLLLRSV